MIEKIKRNKTYLILAVIAVAVSAYVSRENYSALLLCNIGIYIIAVSGLDILFGYSGQISFGNAAFYCVGAYTTALLSKNAGLPALLTLLIGALSATAAGLIIAIPASMLVKHFLSFMTIAFNNVIYNLALNLPITGRSYGFSGIPKLNLFGYVLDSKQKMFVFILIMVVLMLLIKNRILDSRTGRAMIAIRDNTRAAGSCGVNVKKYKIMAFGINAFYVGFAGGLYAHLIGFISPETFKQTTSTVFMTMLLFGGMSTLVGPIIGAVILTLVQNWLQVFSIYQQLVYSVFILIILFFMPNGVMGIVGELIGKLRRPMKGKMGGGQ